MDLFTNKNIHKNVPIVVTMQGCSISIFTLLFREILCYICIETGLKKLVTQNKYNRNFNMGHL